jgi:general secretion pathway protein F
MVMFALLTYVVPTITGIFTDMKQTLPLPTLILIGVSDFLQAYWWAIALVIVLSIIALQRYRRTEQGIRLFHTWAIRAPIVGPLNLKIAMARFTRTLGILMQSSIPLLDALDISCAVLNNSILSKSIDNARDLIREGSDIASPLRESGHFPPLVSHMISIGEQSGQLEEMLIRVADTYDSEVQTSIEGLTSLIDPLIIVAMGGVMFGITLAILLPIFEMNTIIR